MFGYVKPFKPHMRICEYETYQAAWYGLRKAVGKNYGSAAKKALCCDFAFLGLLSLAMSGAETEERSFRVSPFKKAGYLVTADDFDFTAAAALILINAKLKSETEKKRFWGRMRSKKTLKSIKKAYQKAAEKYPELAAHVDEQTKELDKLEKENCKSVDRASVPYSNILAEIAERLTDDGEQKPLMRRFGYLLGRFIYISDAFVSVEEDFRTRGFNPLIVGNYVINDLNLPQIQKRTEDSVNFTLGSLSDCYVQIEMKQFKPIIDNVVYLGLKNSFYDLVKQKEEQPEED